MLNAWDIHQLEKQMKKTLNDIEKREKQIMDLRQIATKFLSSTCPHCLYLRKFLAKSKITLIPRPSSLPDLAPCDISFSKIEGGVKGKKI